MLFKFKRTWKDVVEGPAHQTFSRRDFLARGLITGAMTTIVPKALMGDWVKTAEAGTLICPTPSLNPGAICQVYSSGGPTMGARFISPAQASIVASNSGAAAAYGVTGSNFVTLGPGLVVDSTSPFGLTLMQGPPGYPAGSYADGPTNWQKTVLAKCSGGGHCGPFNADDGAGQNSGIVGAVSPYKASYMGKDLHINGLSTRAPWAVGTPAFAVTQALSPAVLEAPFALHPTTSTNAAEFTNAANGANAIANALSPLMGTGARKGGQQMLTTAGCSFSGNANLTNPSYAQQLFDPTQISALTSYLNTQIPIAPGSMTKAAGYTLLTPEEQAQYAAFYQSALGMIGGVIIQFGGRDYHGTAPDTNITPIDIEDARTLVMFLAACDAAGKPGALIYNSNGQAIASGTQSVNNTSTIINGVQQTVNAPVAKGDAGGTYNAGLLICYSPSGAPPTLRYTGTFNNTTAAVRMDPNVASAQNALAGLYLSALSWVSGGQLNGQAIAAMQKSNLAANPTNVLLL